MSGKEGHVPFRTLQSSSFSSVHMIGTILMILAMGVSEKFGKHYFSRNSGLKWRLRDKDFSCPQQTIGLRNNSDPFSKFFFFHFLTYLLLKGPLVSTNSAFSYSGNHHHHHHHHVMPLARISLTLSPYHSSLLAGLQSYIPYPHIAAVCMFELVVLLLLGHMRVSIGVHHLWVRPCFSSSVLRVWFV